MSYMITMVPISDKPLRVLDPVMQAVTVLSVCEDDYHKARERAAANYVQAATKADADYWYEVLEVFDLEGKAEA